MYNILVVDDDKEIVKAIEIYLEKENYFIYKILNIHISIIDNILKNIQVTEKR